MRQALAVVLLCACGSNPAPAPDPEFGSRQRVSIRGYSDHAMEPFLTRDGRFLLFNNSNDPPSENVSCIITYVVRGLPFR